MLAPLLLLLLFVPEDSATWTERIQKKPREAQKLVQSNDTAKLDSVVAGFLKAKDQKSLNALGWRAVAALPATSEAGRLLEAHNLVSGVIAKAYAPKGFEVVLGPEIGAEMAAEPESLTLEWEYGSGHGFTLKRYRAHWSKDGLHVTRMRYFRNVRTDKKQGVITESTVIPKRSAAVVLRMVLAATALKLEKSVNLHSITSSSANFHVRCRIDAERPIFRKQFTGYRGSRGAPRYVALSVCNKLLNEALATCEWKPETPTDLDLADLAKRLESLESESWWVKERLILMAGMVGDERCLPALKKTILGNQDRTRRPHLYAINAYARISGVDLRPEAFSVKEVPATRAKYRARFAENSAAQKAG